MNSNQFNPYPNVNSNYNLQGTCNLCRGVGSYINNGVNVPCPCSTGSSSQQGFNSYLPNNNFNMYQNPNFVPAEKICDSSNYHPHHKNFLSRTFSAISDCLSCAGKGFQRVFTRSGHQKVCYDCIRESGYCPVCQNTGYKIHSGKRCKCELY